MSHPINNPTPNPNPIVNGSSEESSHSQSYSDPEKRIAWVVGEIELGLTRVFAMTIASSTPDKIVEVDYMGIDGVLEQASGLCREGAVAHAKCQRWGNELVVLVDTDDRYDWVLSAVQNRLRDELSKRCLHDDPIRTQLVDLARRQRLRLCGFELHLVADGAGGSRVKVRRLRQGEPHENETELISASKRGWDLFVTRRLDWIRRVPLFPLPSLALLRPLYFKLSSVEIPRPSELLQQSAAIAWAILLRRPAVTLVVLAFVGIAPFEPWSWRLPNHGPSETTQSVRQLEPIQKVAIGKNNEILINDDPFFPLGSWYVIQRPFLHSIGINTLASIGRKKKQYCDGGQKDGFYLMVQFNEDIKEHPAVFAYVDGRGLNFEPKKSTPLKAIEKVVNDYKKIQIGDRTRPVCLDISDRLIDGIPENMPDRHKHLPLIVRGCDILSVGVCPIYNYNRDDKLVWVGDGVTQLRKYGGPDKPVFAHIETCKWSKRNQPYDKQKKVTTDQMRAEAWIAIIRGATGLFYHIEAFPPPPLPINGTDRQKLDWGPDDDMDEALARLNKQITRLAPAILAEPAKVQVSLRGSISGEVMGREHNGSLYLFAVNTRADKGAATIQVEGLSKDQIVQVLDEGRSITADDGKFVDDFAPNAVHLYRIGPPESMSESISIWWFVIPLLAVGGAISWWTLAKRKRRPF